ncbi:MAG: glycerophosphodiester phosphodiesterase family protein, partial [Candidatus Nanopelagicales bacterium]
RLADGATPLRLEELLESYSDIWVNVDVKEPGSVPAVHAAVERCRAWHRVCVTSFSARRTSRMRGLTAPVTAAHPIEVLAHRGALPWPQPPPEGQLRLQVPPSVLGRPLVTEGFLARAQARGLAVDVWTIDDPAQMHRLLDLGVDGIMTDRPTALREVLLSRGLWPGSEHSNTCS